MQPTFQPETIYHIYTHANGSENLFRSEDNYHYFLRKYGEYIYPVAETYAYCLMPNHIHFLIKIRKEEELLNYMQQKKKSLILNGLETLGGVSMVISRQFSHLFNGYTQAYNKSFDRRGSLFIPNFKRKEVADDTYLIQLIVYIHNNPVHHQLARNAIDWPYSSFQAYLTTKSSKVSRQYFTSWFGSSQAYLDFHKKLVKTDGFITEWF